ncbi:MAG TPA: PPC domain-containing protein, partial [Pirellulaceae bacterium]
MEPLEDRCLLAVFTGELITHEGTANPQVSQGPLYDELPPLTDIQRELLDAHAGAQPDPSFYWQNSPGGPETDSSVLATESAPESSGTQNPDAPEDFRLYRNSDLPVSDSSPTNEPSVASLDQGMFVTRNWSAAVSSDHGKSWSNISPYTTFASIDGGFCCDQRAAHDENRDMLLWYLQYIKSGTSSSDQGGIRIARTNTQASLALNLWTSYVFEPSNFGYGTGEWLDFPDMETTDTFAYFTSNVFATTNDAYVGTAYWRISLDELQAGGSVNYSWTTVTTGTIGLATNAEDTMYAATVTASTTVRIFTWPDSSGTITLNDVGGLGTTYFGTHTSNDVNGFNWTGRGDARVQSGYVAGDDLGFFWNSAQGGARAKPFVRALVVNRVSKAVLSQPDVWHPTVTWHYPAISSNGRGHLAGTIGYNTENGPVGTSILIDDDFTSGWESQFGSLGNDGPRQNRWGDYLDAKPDDDFPNTWIATGFHHNGTTTTTDFFWFGRERDTPCGGPDDHGNSVGAATSVNIPSTTAGTIELNCDVDWFRVTAEGGGTYSFETSLGSLGDSVLALFASDGTTQLAFDDDSGPGLASRIRWTAPATGTYYVRAQAFNNGDSGSYALRIERLSNYLSLDAPATVTNSNGTTLTADDSDILELRQFPGGHEYRLFFDGSDQGLTTAAEDIDAFSILEDGSIVVSTLGGFNVPGPGGNIVGNDEDLLRFIPTRTGPATLGTWEFYFD